MQGTVIQKKVIQKKGEISEHDMYHTFNMGIGMCAVVAPEDAETAVAVLRENGIKAGVIGRIIPGDHSVVFRKENA